MKCFPRVGGAHWREPRRSRGCPRSGGDVDGRPAGIDDVDQHQRVVIGQVDDDVVRRVVGAVPGQVDPLAADVSVRRSAKVSSLGGRAGFVVAQQQTLGLLVSDARDVLAEEERRAGMVGMVVRVDRWVTFVADTVDRRDLGRLARWMFAADRGRRSSRTTPSEVVRNADW